MRESLVAIMMAEVTNAHKSPPHPLNPGDGKGTAHQPDDTDPGQFGEPNGGGNVKDGAVTLAEFQAAQQKI